MTIPLDKRRRKEVEALKERRGKKKKRAKIVKKRGCKAEEMIKRGKKKRSTQEVENWQSKNWY